GVTGLEAVELMLQANWEGEAPAEPGTQARREPRPPRLAVKAIDHVTLVVKDLAQSRRFYLDVLGMREVPRPAFSFAGLWFQAGKTQLHLILEYSGSGPAGNLLPAERRTSRTHHLAFAVEDAAAAFALLQERQVAVLSGPKPRPD